MAATLKTYYLVAYNALQALGWACCLASLVRGLAAGHSPAQIYAIAGPITKLFQGLSLAEVLHAAVGLVPSSPVSALMQWGGRSNVLYAVLGALAQAQSSWWGVVLLLAWSLSEVVRYPWYAAQALGACPRWLTWLRYSAFLPLYPAGVVAEMALLAGALPDLRAGRMYSFDMPNALNWAFHYDVFIMALLPLYPLLWWQLYSGLLRTRAKKLAAGAAPPPPQKHPAKQL